MHVHGILSLPHEQPLPVTKRGAFNISFVNVIQDAEALSQDHTGNDVTKNNIDLFTIIYDYDLWKNIKYIICILYTHKMIIYLAYILHLVCVYNMYNVIVHIIICNVYTYNII